MNKKIKIGLVQYSPVWEDKISSKRKIENLLRKKLGYDLLIFPRNDS
jgi:predicted amidohydrolase